MPAANSDSPHAGLKRPVAQSFRMTLMVLRVFIVLLLLGWATGNMRQVPPGYQAVTLRLGRVAAVQPSGLVLAWPRPLDKVVLVPDGEQQLVLAAAAPGTRTAGAVHDQSAPDDAPTDAGTYLTGDNGVVLLRGSITWRIADAAAFAVARDHAPAALRLLFRKAAVGVLAARSLDDVLAARPDMSADPAAEDGRTGLRGALVAAMNRDLTSLTDGGAGLGLAVTGADMKALLPPLASSSFDAASDARQRAEQAVEAARADAARMRQQADRDRDSLLTAARASAQERVAAARIGTADIAALETRMDRATRPALLDQLYRDRIGAILARAGSVNTVDAKSVSRLILPGAQ